MYDAQRMIDVTGLASVRVEAVSREALSPFTFSGFDIG